MRKYPKKMQTCCIRLDYKIWNTLKKISDKSDDKSYDKGASKIVRRCVDYCIEKNVVEKLANIKD